MRRHWLPRFFALAMLCDLGLLPRARADEIGLMPGVPLAPHDVTSSVKTGVIDSGVRLEHPQIGNSVSAVRDFTGEGPGDSYGHGTKVILVLLHSHYKNRSLLAQMNAPSQLPEIAVAKVIGAKRASAQVVADRISDAILWLAELDVQIVNVSLSLPVDGADYTRLCATMGAQEKMLFTIAAGNSGEASVVYPAACPIKNKIVVGASQDGKVPDYSGPSDIVAELPPANVSPAEYWYLEGVALYRNKDPAGARRAFERGLQSRPTSEQAGMLTYNLGVLALDAHDETRAMDLFEEAIRIAPTFAEPYAGIAAIHSGAERFDAARVALERGLSAGAHSAALHERLARVHMDLDRPKDALREMDELKREGAEPDKLWQLRLTAENMLKIENWIDAGQSALVVASAMVAANDGQLLRFVIHRWHPDLDAVPTGAAVPLLVTAAGKGQRAIVRLLLESGAAVDAHDRTNQITALMAAANTGHEIICRDLLARGADIELRDDFGFTPLTFAAGSGHTAIVRLLLDRGATTTGKSREGWDALDYARRRGHPEIAKMIEAARQR